MARVHVSSWQAAYRGLLPDAYLDQLRPEDRAARYDFSGGDPLKPRTIVAVDGEAVIGFATTMPSRDPDLPQDGELCALYVHPNFWNRGIGVSLVESARGHLFQCGFRAALLWVLAGNTRAERFYQIDGWVEDGHQRTETMWGVPVREIRYRRELGA